MILSAMGSHGFVVTQEANEEDPVVYGFGRNGVRQLGFWHWSTGNNQPRSPLTRIDLPSIGCESPISHGSLCLRWSVLVDSKGTAWRSDGPPTSDDISFSMVSGLPPVEQVACGLEHSLALGEDGSVWSLPPENAIVSGPIISQLAELRPQRILLPPARRITCGSNFSVVEVRDGGLWAFGGNFNGQLGIGCCSKEELTPQQVVLPANFASGPVLTMSAGADFLLVVDNNGAAWTCGSHFDGRLGRRSGQYCKTLLERVVGLPPVRRAAAGSTCVLVLDEDGLVWVWGRSGLASEAGGTSAEVFEVPHLATQLQDVVDVAAGRNHAAVATRDGKVHLFGSNENFELGVPELPASCQPLVLPVPPLVLPSYKSAAKSARSAIAKWDRETK